MFYKEREATLGEQTTWRTQVQRWSSLEDKPFHVLPGFLSPHLSSCLGVPWTERRGGNLAVTCVAKSETDCHAGIRGSNLGWDCPRLIHLVSILAVTKNDKLGQLKKYGFDFREQIKLSWNGTSNIYHGSSGKLCAQALRKNISLSEWIKSSGNIAIPSVTPPTAPQTQETRQSW